MQVLTRMIVINAVPMFFFISGFLFFLKEDTYLCKWKKRAKTLLIPYLVWCVIGFAIPFFFQEILGLAHMYKGGVGHLKPVAEFEGLDYFRMFWNIRNGSPINSVLWFLRNLIVLVVLTPIIKLFVMKLRIVFPALLLVNYLFFGYGFLTVLSGDLFFFCSGCYLSIMFKGKGLFWLESLNIKWLLPLWILTLTAGLVAYCNDYYPTKFINVFIVIDR